MHNFIIVCEKCGKVTDSGVITTDKSKRLRLFCSKECMEEQQKVQDETKIKKKWWKK